MGTDGGGSRPPWPGASQPPGAQPYVPVVRTVPLRAVTGIPPQPGTPGGQHAGPHGPSHQGHPHARPLPTIAMPTIPNAPPGAGSSPPPAPQGHGLAGTVVMHAEPMVVPTPPPPPPAPPPPPRELIEEAPFIEVPTRVAMMSDWPTGHPAAELFKHAPPPTRRERGGSRVIAVAFGVALAAGGIAAGVFFGLRHVSSRPLPPSPTSEGATVDVPVSDDTASPVSSQMAAVDASALTPGPSATPSATSDATASATSSASAAGPADDAGLLSYEARLTVTSSADAEVYVQGVASGRTNRALVVRCGSRNVRLRKDDGAWLTRGAAMKIPCMKATTLAIEPD